MSNFKVYFRSVYLNSLAGGCLGWKVNVLEIKSSAWANLNKPKISFLPSVVRLISGSNDPMCFAVTSKEVKKGKKRSKDR